MRSVMLAALVVLAEAQPGAAQPQSSSPQAVPAGLAERMAAMAARDRLDDPDKELAAWTAFDAAVASDPGASPEIRARAKLGLAVSYFYAIDLAKGLAAAEESLRIAQANGLSEARFVPELYAYLSLLTSDRSKRAEALAYGEKSLELAGRLFGEKSAEYALAQNALAYIAWGAGNFDRAAGLLIEAVRRPPAPTPAENAMIVNNLSSLSAMLTLGGRLEEALEQGQRAVEWQQKYLRPDHPIGWLTFTNYGRLLVIAGRFGEAEPVLRRAIDLARAKFGPNDYRTLAALANLGNVLQPLGKREEAETLLVAAGDATIALRLGRDPASGQRTLQRAAQVAMERGSPERALASVAGVVKEDHVDLARMRIDVAQSYRLAGRVAEAAALGAKAMPVVRKSLAVDHPDRLDAEILDAQIVAAGGDAARGYALARPVAALLEQRLLNSATSRRELVQLGPRFANGFAAFAELALRTGKTDEAFRAAQLAGLSELAITDGEVAARAAIGDPKAASLARQLQDAALKLNALKQALTRVATTGQDPAAITADLAATEQRLRETEVELDRSFPAFRALSRPRAVALDAFRATLARDQALILPLALDDGTLVMAVTRDGLVWAKSAANGHAVRAMVERLRGDLDVGAFDRGTAHALYTAIFPKIVQDAVAPKTTLLFPASGPLASLPPALLVTKPARRMDESWRRTAWLIRDKAIAILPSFGRGGVQDAAVRRTGFVGVGAPVLAAPDVQAPRLAAVFRGGAPNLAELKQLPSLPDSARELQALKAALPGGRSVLLTGAAATEPALQALDLTGLSVLAFATHGLVSGELNGLHEPALVLTPPATLDAGNDGLLTASEIARLRLAVDWVILSACNTASGSVAGTPSYSGLARAFLHAGARSLLLSHWRVRDDAAARLTVDTVRNAAKGAARSQALRRAMLSLIDDPKVRDGAHPSVWAPFVVIDR